MWKSFTYYLCVLIELVACAGIILVSAVYFHSKLQRQQEICDVTQRNLDQYRDNHQWRKTVSNALTPLRLSWLSGYEEPAIGDACDGWLLEALDKNPKLKSASVWTAAFLGHPFIGNIVPKIDDFSSYLIAEARTVEIKFRGYLPNAMEFLFISHIQKTWDSLVLVMAVVIVAGAYFVRKMSMKKVGASQETNNVSQKIDCVTQKNDNEGQKFDSASQEIVCPCEEPDCGNQEIDSEPEKTTYCKCQKKTGRRNKKNTGCNCQSEAESNSKKKEERARKRIALKMQQKADFKKWLADKKSELEAKQEAELDKKKPEMDDAVKNITAAADLSPIPKGNKRGNTLTHNFQQTKKKHRKGRKN